MITSKLVREFEGDFLKLKSCLLKMERRLLQIFQKFVRRGRFSIGVTSSSETPGTPVNSTSAVHSSALVQSLINRRLVSTNGLNF